MTTITRFTTEQLTKWAKDCRMLAQCAVDARPDDVAAAKNLALAEIALASLDAKARKVFTCTGCGAEGLDEPLESRCHCGEDGAHWVESVVYTAPPALVSVPDERAAFNAWNNDTDCPIAGRDAKTAAWLAWSRGAATLQGKFRDLSQPVDPQVAEYEQIMLQADWVMVPVEPTDEMIAAALECEGVIFDSKDPTAFCVQYREIYCAMVDVAPKQEGNNG
ncbi:TPA: hypothetical protein R4B31_001690 [Salmonella enterica subsp. enterica serovar Saintpaul]|nr:hypothetical protein [Salmonella enterica subsp. enterica serovar Saintpaul]